MKFMLNGALTLGTFDGANVEIAQLVGKDNIYTFGASSDEVIAHYKNADYCAKDLYEKDEMVKEQALADYKDRAAWGRKMLINTAMAGFFSSDRTIRQYNTDIWKL